VIYCRLCGLYFANGHCLHLDADRALAVKAEVERMRATKRGA
jgi:hypothetical protein